MVYIYYCSSSPDKKEFDAFVSYAKWSSFESEASSSLNEENLALNLFPEILENKYGYTLCLLERDVAPGGGRSCMPREKNRTKVTVKHKCSLSSPVTLSFGIYIFWNVS